MAAETKIINWRNIQSTAKFERQMSITVCGKSQTRNVVSILALLQFSVCLRQSNFIFIFTVSAALILFDRLNALVFIYFKLPSLLIGFHYQKFNFYFQTYFCRSFLKLSCAFFVCV